MDVAAVTVVLATVFLWGVVSARLERARLSAPIFFVVAGFLFGQALDLFELDVGNEAVKLVAEITLVWVLFADAAGVNLKKFRTDIGMYVRLLGVGLPLTVGLGTGVAIWLLGFDPWAALLLGAALAPTDAALGAPVMTNPAVPARIRRVLNVESGLNDGIATPIVLVAIAGVATEMGIEGVEGPGRAAVALLVGLVVGALVGVVGGMLTRQTRRRGWLSEDFAGPAVLALALLAYACSLLVDGNGFVAAFVGGLAFGATAGRGEEKEVYYVEQTGSLASAVAWLLFGALAIPIIGVPPEWRVVVYALLSLTVIRMLPVALSLIGTDIDRPGVAFIGWFGPRGLASVIFALLALEDLEGGADAIVATIALTVLLSVVAHGLTAAPLANRYAKAEDAVPSARPDASTEGQAL
jgi:NhaP-type Na+/H+ or K+/H+ antiporter